MAPKGKDYDTDWIWSSTSNIHVANHRDWFSTFTPLASTISRGSESHVIEGIGEVSLDVRLLLGAAAKAAKNKAMVNSTIVLRNVLYVPTFRCNVLGEPVIEDYSVSIGVNKLLMDKNTGRGLGLLERNEAGLTKVILKGQAKGQSSFKKEDVSEVSVKWSDEEKKKWIEQTVQQGHRGGIHIQINAHHHRICASPFLAGVETTVALKAIGTVDWVVCMTALLHTPRTH
ncbi:hypothetical protein LTR78_005838 [Recurvomyces mirabilis]|uniref:Retrovirus-related Pol polyprotein from transposon TNT 1-94-like beta-barrel domain-containing protein n=1 Tax=Recurvomyces mirabilis TaxID=574656 RepID=A0AAE0WMC7_9PEZI|nr:hypothetical protein LTR78_005838 [Recurvomyces mirabilis]KAK5154218.1 hypothetical protein LTS14_006903 [Recurvomyces mirabilis]